VKYSECTPEERAKRGRYGAENGPSKVARHFLSLQMASCHVAYVEVVTPFLVEGPNHQIKNPPN